MQLSAQAFQSLRNIDSVTDNSELAVRSASQNPSRDKPDVEADSGFQRRVTDLSPLFLPATQAILQVQATL